MAVRFSIGEFALANPIYSGATVTFYTVSGGAATSTKATLYEATTGSGTLANPQRLDGSGKFRQPVYTEVAVVAAVSGLSIADHSTGIIGNADSSAAASATAAAASASAAATSATAAANSATAAAASASSIDLPTAVANTILIRNAGNSAYVPTNAADTRAFLGLGTMATQAASAVAVTGGTITFGVSELTISSGSVTPTGQNHTVDTESDSASDDLATIVTTNVPDEGRLTIRAAHTDRTVVVKNGTGNLFTADGSDLSLDDDKKSITFQRRGSNFYETSRSVTFGSVQIATATPYTTASALSDAIPEDDTIPQNTEGTEILTAAITPRSASSTIKIEVEGMWTAGGAARLTIALFVDSTADAIAAAQTAITGANVAQTGTLLHYLTSGSTTARTYKVRIGACTPNAGSGGSRVLGGVAAWRMTVTEFA